MILHMIWLGERTKAVDDVIDANRTLCDDGDKLELHTDEDLLLEHYWATYDTFAIAPQTKSDLLRHSILETHGGLYVDCDVRLAVSPSELVRRACWDRYSFPSIGTMPFWNPDILYCPLGWTGWSVVHRYVEAFDWKDARIPVTTFAHRMLNHILKTIPDHVEATIDPVKFPSSLRECNQQALAYRNGLTKGASNEDFLVGVPRPVWRS